MWATSSGSLRLNWQRKRIGRITRVSGETTQRGLQNAHALLDQLYRYDHDDVLVAVRDGRIDMRWLMALHRSGQLDVRRPSLASLLLRSRPVADLLDEHLPRMGRAASSRTRYRAWVILLLATTSQDITVGGLLDVDWREQQARWEKSASSWNGMRTP